MPDGSRPGRSRDAVLTRAARLAGPARDRAAGVLGTGRAELWLVAPRSASPQEALTSASPAGCWRATGEVVRFRHEIARSSVEAELSPLRRRELERSVLAALLDREGVDLARVVHHARRAADRGVVLAHAPAAARAASARGGARQAAEHYRAALAVAEDARARGARRAARGALVETYLAGAPSQEALASRREALAIRRGSADRPGEGSTSAGCRAGSSGGWAGRGGRGGGRAAPSAVLEPLGARQPSSPWPTAGCPSS